MDMLNFAMRMIFGILWPVCVVLYGAYLVHSASKTPEGEIPDALFVSFLLSVASAIGSILILKIFKPSRQ